MQVPDLRRMGADIHQDRNHAIIKGVKNLTGANVVAKVEKQGKAKKIYVFKMKRKKNERKKKGHRQPFTKVTIEKINA